MQTNQLLLIFCGALLLLGLLAFFAGRSKATRLRSAGTAMFAQPDQYAWFAVLSTAGPAILVGAIGAFILLLLGADIPTLYLLAASLVVAAIGLLVSLNQVRPDFHARQAIERVIRKILAGAALISIFTTFGILFSIISEALRFFQMHSFWEFITGTTWNPGASFLASAGRGDGSGAEFGSVPLFAGTFMITAIAMLVAVPIGLLSAIYLSEYAGRKVRGVVKPLLEMLAGIPTVVYGFFAALTVAPFISDLAASMGIEASSQSALAAGAVMGIMIIPFVSSLSDDVINAVPQAMRDGSLALGATQSETMKKVIFPAALPGIMGGILLAVSRAIGETMIVVMAAGLAANLTANPLETVTTVTVQIVTLLTGDQEFDSAKTLAAFALGAMLFLATLLLNVIALKIVRKYREQYD